MLATDKEKAPVVATGAEDASIWYQSREERCINHNKPVSRLYGVGTVAWRRHHGLLGIRDLCRDYAAIRAPRGAYNTPLPGDYREVRQ